MLNLNSYEWATRDNVDIDILSLLGHLYFPIQLLFYGKGILNELYNCPNLQL